MGAALHCLAKDVSEGNFWLKRSGKDLELRLTAAGEGVTVVPPMQPAGLRSGFYRKIPSTQLFRHAACCTGACEL